MSFSGAIETAVGLIFIYFIFSSICSGLNEAISQFLNKRADFLEGAIWQLLDDRPQPGAAVGAGAKSEPGTLFAGFWTHPLIQQLAAPLPTNWIRRVGRTFQRRLNAKSRAPIPKTIKTARTLALAIDPGATATQGSATGVGDPTRPILPPASKRPSYIDAKTFGTVVMGILIPDKTHPGSLDQIRIAVNDLPASKARTALQDMVAAAATDVAAFRKNIEDWFNSEMDRASGWYKRYTKKVLVILSVIVVVALNIDTIGMARTLWESPQTRSLVTAAADAQINAAATRTTVGGQSNSAPAIVCPTSPPGSSTTTSISPPTTSALQVTAACVDGVRSLEIPIGWTLAPCAPPNKCATFLAKLAHGITTGWDQQGVGSLALKLLGWIVSIIALSMGAPFWWDLLNRFGSLQSTGNRPAPPNDPTPTS